MLVTWKKVGVIPSKPEDARAQILPVQPMTKAPRRDRTQGHRLRLSAPGAMREGTKSNSVVRLLTAPRSRVQ
jgi:hypothetical protein